MVDGSRNELSSSARGAGAPLSKEEKVQISLPWVVLERQTKRQTPSAVQPEGKVPTFFSEAREP
jgi:hypothetical protein